MFYCCEWFSQSHTRWDWTTVKRERTDGRWSDRERKGGNEGSSPLSVPASPLIYGNVWSRWSIIVSWNLTIKISEVLVAGGAGRRLSSNHSGFTLLMMGRELIYPREKQIKALLSPVLCHTIAYINILSWVIQVSKGLVHLHFHKGPLSTSWPPLLSQLSSWWVPAVLSFTSLSSSSFHFSSSSLSIFQQCLLSFLLSISALAPSSTWTPAVFAQHFSSSCLTQKSQIFILAWLRCLNPLWHRRITCWQTV